MLAVGLHAATGCAASCQSKNEATGVDAAPSAAAVDAPTTEGDAGMDRVGPPCKSTFVPAADCVHPPVVARCANGWCVIPHGCFVMGSPECQPGRARRGEDESQVTITHDFEIQQYEVSKAEWSAAGLPIPTGKSPSGETDCKQTSCPVGWISWFDAVAYANRLSAAHQPPLSECYTLLGCTGTLGVDLACTGVAQTTASLNECGGYRLPTEAEWEYAARAGSRDAFYLGPMLPQTLAETGYCRVEPNLEPAAWYCINAGNQTHPRGQKVPNAFGLFDVLGNAWEWTSDPERLGGAGPGPHVDPGADIAGIESRVVRGGLITGTASAATLSRRLGGTWNVRGAPVGVRLVRTTSGDGG